MAEVRVAGRLHVEHGHERGADNPVEYPLESHSGGHGCATDGVGENLGNEHPADGAPRHHERGTVDHDAEHRHHLQSGLPEREGHAERTDGHAYRTGDEQRLAPPLLHGQDGHEGEEDVDHTHDDGLHHRVLHAHVAEDARRIVEHGVDAHCLLEDAEHDAHEDDQHAVGEDFLRLFRDGVLDFAQDVVACRMSVDAAEHGQGFVMLSGHDKIARRLGHEADQESEQPGGHGLAAEHVSPAGLDSPRVAARSHGVDALADGLDDGVGVVAQNEEVHHIDHQLAKDDGKLVPRHQRAADVAWRHLGNIHGADGRSQTHAHATDDTVNVEGDEQRIVGHPMFEEQELRLHRTQGGNEEHDARKDERTLAPPVGGKVSRQGTADDAPDEGAGTGEAVPPVSIDKVRRPEEEGLQALLGAGNDSRVIAEEEAAQDSHQHNGK